MKKIVIILLISIAILSCNKEQTRNNAVGIPEYVGTYTSVSGDTAYVSVTDPNYTTIKWRFLGVNGHFDFDSVRVVSDLSFTVNQRVIYYDNTRKTAIGSGSFGTNTIQFIFVIDGNQYVNFNGIKK